jgi:hypothetical protein
MKDWMDDDVKEAVERAIAFAGPDVEMFELWFDHDWWLCVKEKDGSCEFNLTRHIPF